MSSHILYIDEAWQPEPSRATLSAIFSWGAFVISSAALTDFDSEVSELCLNYGFPEGDPFKWSPGSKLWMHNNLVSQSRTDFFCSVSELLQKYEATAFVASVDIRSKEPRLRRAQRGLALQVVLERAHMWAGQNNSTLSAVMNTPGGGKKEAKRAGSRFAEIVNAGTEYQTLLRINPSVRILAARESRALQATDLVASSTTALFAGEVQFSPPVVEVLMPLFYGYPSNVVGWGIKGLPESIIEPLAAFRSI